MDARDEQSFLAEHRQGWGSVVSGAVLLAAVLAATTLVWSSEIIIEPHTSKLAALGPALELRGSDLGHPSRQWLLRRSGGAGREDGDILEELAAGGDELGPSICD